MGVPAGNNRQSTLIRVAEAVAGTDPGRAALLTADAERIAQSMVTGFQMESTLARVALAVARLDLSRAEDIARSISDEAFKTPTLADIAEAVADTDPEPDRGERIARSINDEQGKASALARVARAVAGTDLDRAEQIAGSIPDPYLKALALAGVAEASQAPNQPSVAAGHSDGTDALTDLLYRDAVDIYLSGLEERSPSHGRTEAARGMQRTGISSRSTRHTQTINLSLP